MLDLIKGLLVKLKNQDQDLPSGHIPNSKSLPSSELLTNDGYLKSLDEINKFFQKINVRLMTKLIATCGSGVSACVITSSFILFR